MKAPEVMHLFIDTETTGIPTRRGASHTDLDVWPRIVSVSWILGRSASDLARHSYAVIRPEGFRIPPDATRIHGITTERAMKEGRPLREVLAELQGDIDTLQPARLVAHNVAFDRPILLAEMLRASVNQRIESLPTYCTMSSTVNYCRIPRVNGGYKWPTLSELHRALFGQSHVGAHDARADILACARCYFRMQELGLVSA